MLRSLVLKSIKKDLSTNHVQILILALVIAVASVTSVGFFTDRVSSGMKQQATQLMGADLIVKSSRPIADNIQAIADELQLRSATVVSFPSVVLNEEDDSKLVAVKAVSENYPLYGDLITKPIDNNDEDVKQSVGPPSSRQAYADPSLVGGLALIDANELALGNTLFEVNEQIITEPDRSAGLFELAPRLMINLHDLDEAKLLVAGSRARYQLMLAGSALQIQQFTEAVNNLDTTGIELRGPESARSEISRVLVQINHFFGLVAIIAVMLSGAAIALSANSYASNQALSGAILRTLGFERREVALWIFLRLMMMALIALVLGLILGVAAQAGLVALLGRWFAVELPGITYEPVVKGIAVTLISLLGFASLPVMRAGALPVVSVLRRQQDGLKLSFVLVAGVALSSVALMMLLQVGDVTLVVVLLFALLLMFLVFAFAGQLIYRFLRHFIPSSWVLPRFVLRRRSRSAVMQLSVYGFIIMVILMISIMQKDILQQWQVQLPGTVPDRFLVNIQPSRAQSVTTFLEEHYGFENELNPVSRGRLIAVNGESVDTRYEGVEKAQGYLNHEFNLSFSDHKPAHNELIEGQWWQPDSTDFSLSLEQRFASRMGLSLGDSLTFQIAGVIRKAVVKNIRSVNWQSFRVNFFAITSDNVLKDLPFTYITSFRQDGVSETVNARLIRENPGLTVIEVDKMIGQVRGVIDKASLAIEAVFTFTVAAGLVVLLAAVQGNMPERMREIAILRAMGASHQQLKQSVFLEFSLIGGVAGFLAALFATLSASIIAEQVMNFTLTQSPWVWLYGIACGALVIGFIGYLSCRRILDMPPLIVLQKT